ncbi:MAG: class I SAM-dependent methyltransferase, partial [Calditrichaeota bacterium]
DEILEMTRTLHLDSGNTRVLDLGCGKGAVSVQLASNLGFQVTGIDIMPAFLEEARKKAREYKVGNLCIFREEDILEYVRESRDFDLVILASLGGIFGSLKNTVAQMRTQIRSGGYMVIDDGFLKNEKSLQRIGYEHYRTHQESIEELTRFGDHLIQEVNTTGVSLKINEEYLRKIKNRGSELKEIHPELAEDIEAYISRQQEDCRIIDEKLEGALWLLQKKTHL